MRYLLRGILILIGIAFAACDDAPEDKSADATGSITADKGLFIADGAKPGSSQDTSETGIVRFRLVRLDAGLMKSLAWAEGDKVVAKTGSQKQLVRLNLFPDLVVTAELEASPVAEGMPLFYGGQIVDQETSLVTLMLQDGAVNGNVRLDGHLYRVRPEGEGRYRIEEVAAIKLPDHAPMKPKGNE